MHIIEIYHSLQGEGPFTGLPTLFVRTAGCDLRCRYCDSSFSFQGGIEYEAGEILTLLAEWPCRRVLVTGGEPLLQKDLPSLLELLLKEGYGVSVETAGHHDLSALPREVLRVVDVKTPDSGAAGSFREENLALLHHGDELKFVTLSLKDVDWALAFCARPDLPEGLRLRISPAWSTLPLDQVARKILDSGLDVGLSLQQHKIIWGERRGV